MAQDITLGGDRLGSGNKQKVELHNYGMNSFNLERDWKSSMAPGILYPCFKEIGTNHGTFDIDVDSFVRTLPTKGPLFGSFKMQVDFFNVPFRLYQGILHNNPVDIGLNMHQVKLPKLVVGCKDASDTPIAAGSNIYTRQVNNTALLKYTGMSGWGHSATDVENVHVKRKIQCIPELGYYDIFKNYYSNKQEENAYVITPGIPAKEYSYTKKYVQENLGINPITINYTKEQEKRYINFPSYEGLNTDHPINKIHIETYENLNKDTIEIEMTFKDGSKTVYDLDDSAYWQARINENNLNIEDFDLTAYEGQDPTNTVVNWKINLGFSNKYTANIELTPFALKNIDKMRAKLLANNELGQEFTIVNDTESADNSDWGTDSGEDTTGLPYAALVKETSEGISWNAFIQNGLVVKTYQSDLFHNWLDNSFIATIQNRVKIDTTGGGFTPDTLILTEKIYELLNRILVSGGTYYDWQEATYGEGVARMCEIPLYIGGMSAEIMFEEVISNSDVTTTQGGYQPLGTLGGKGTIATKKGGNNIHVKMDEPGYIMAIVSLTPRVCYNQGNDWDRTELDTLDDLHKPGLDGIGFQDMMVEQLAWWNTSLAPNGTGVVHRDSYGKQIAWINYQTAVDKSFGDFAEVGGYSFMVLNRNYEMDGRNGVKDITTYIDPAKYNYAFAVQDLSAQNFWVQLHFKVTARRKMGAQQLPNL